jgi:alginate O-acetyltransferase complex protein AlgI
MLWFGVLLQPVLLYLDFSGYCDIMIGLTRLMGFRLAENFDAPWRAQNIQDFWNRWHITLSHFVRDYVFNPTIRLVYFHVNSSRQWLCLMLLYFATMILIAVWHATTWGFLVFGIMHGLMLVALQVAQRHVYPNMPEAAREYWMKSWLSVTFARTANFVFISVTMLIWNFGVARSAVILRQLVGGLTWQCN